MCIFYYIISEVICFGYTFVMLIPDYFRTYLPETGELSVISRNILGINSHIEELSFDLKNKGKRMILISGLSGSGKDTIMEELLKKNPMLKRVKTSTTRKRRAEEFEFDDPYERISYEEFTSRVKGGDVLEFVEYAGNYYFTSKSAIDEIMNSNSIPVLRVDPVGAKTFMDMWRDGKHPFEDTALYYFFIVPESLESLRERLVKRGDALDTIEGRMEQSKKDVTLMGEAMYVVINREGELEEVVGEILAIFGDGK